MTTWQFFSWSVYSIPIESPVVLTVLNLNITFACARVCLLASDCAIEFGWSVITHNLNKYQAIGLIPTSPTSCPQPISVL